MMLAHEIAKGRKRRILHDFRLDKIAAVDNPCQEGARVAIIKREQIPDTEERTREHMPTTLTKRATTKAAFDARVTEISKRDACSRLQAMTKVPDEYPDEFEAMQEAGRGPYVDPRAELIAKRRDARETIDRHVREIMKREGVSRLKAFEMLPDEHPELFDTAPGV